jgi:DivIVA domain-containing protein
MTEGRLAPEEVRTRTFSRVVRGYKRREVRRLLERAATDLARLRNGLGTSGPADQRPLTPEEVEEARFQPALGGYEMDEVDQFLDEVVAELEQAAHQPLRPSALPAPPRPGLLPPAHGFRPPDPDEVREEETVAQGARPVLAPDPDLDRGASPTAQPVAGPEPPMVVRQPLAAGPLPPSPPRPAAGPLPAAQPPPAAGPLPAAPPSAAGPLPAAPPAGPPRPGAGPLPAAPPAGPDLFPAAGPHSAPPVGPDEGFFPPPSVPPSAAPASPPPPPPPPPQAQRPPTLSPARPLTPSEVETRSFDRGAPGYLPAHVDLFLAKAARALAGRDGDTLNRWDVLRQRFPLGPRGYATSEVDAFLVRLAAQFPEPDPAAQEEILRRLQGRADGP